MTIKKKKPFGFFGDFFDFDFEDEMERMQKDMEELFSRMNQNLREEDFERIIKPGQSKVYGFSLHVGPDGKPIFQEFGNIKPSVDKQKGAQLVSDERKPLIDILKGKEEVTVIAEIPGVEEKDIKLGGEESTLVIDVKGKERKYYRKLELQAKVDHSSLKWTYKNGILEVKLKIKK